MFHLVFAKVRKAAGKQNVFSISFRLIAPVHAPESRLCKPLEPSRTAPYGVSVPVRQRQAIRRTARPTQKSVRKRGTKIPARRDAARERNGRIAAPAKNRIWSRIQRRRRRRNAQPDTKPDAKARNQARNRSAEADCETGVEPWIRVSAQPCGCRTHTRRIRSLRGG